MVWIVTICVSIDSSPWNHVTCPFWLDHCLAYACGCVCWWIRHIINFHPQPSPKRYIRVSIILSVISPLASAHVCVCSVWVVKVSLVKWYLCVVVVFVPTNCCVHNGFDTKIVA